MARLYRILISYPVATDCFDCMYSSAVSSSCQNRLFNWYALLARRALNRVADETDGGHADGLRAHPQSS